MADRRLGEPAGGSDDYDVCVVGGGPAGAALALRLGQLARRVAIVERAIVPRKRAAESLSSGISPLLDALGVRSAVGSAGLSASAWATVDWAGEQRRYQLRGEPGLVVDRARFDAQLLQAAAAMPCVRLYRPARVVSATHADHRWEVVLDTGERLRARYLAEASGRVRVRVSSRTCVEGHVPSTTRDRCRRSLGPPTLAMCARWQGADDEEVGETLVEAGQQAWYWGVPLPGGEFAATVFADRGPAGDYERLIRQSRLLGARLRRARRAGDVRVCDATPFADPSPITSTSIKIGDAALAIDPLASQGVQTAIGTAMHAAIVLNTFMDRPDDAELAMDFYRSRLRASADLHAAAAADFYHRQAAFDGGDFWRRRAPTAALRGTPGPLAPGSCLTLAADVLFAPVAVAEASHVARRDGVKLREKTYAFVGEGLAVAPLLRAIDGQMSAFEVVRRWSRSLPAADALEVLRWAWAEGLICPAT